MNLHKLHTPIYRRGHLCLSVQKERISRQNIQEDCRVKLRKLSPHGPVLGRHARCLVFLHCIFFGVNPPISSLSHAADCGSPISMIALIQKKYIDSDHGFQKLPVIFKSDFCAIAFFMNIHVYSNEMETKKTFDLN
jgi:hypothetical protein